MEVKVLPTPADEHTYKLIQLEDLKARGMMTDDEIRLLKENAITNPIDKDKGTCRNCGAPAHQNVSWCGACDANKPINFFK